MKFVDLAPETTTGFLLVDSPPRWDPEPALAQIRAIQAHDLELARKIAADLDVDPRTDRPGDHRRPRSLRQLQHPSLEKMRIALAGYCHAGPLRPPYNVVPRRNSSSAFVRMPAAGASSASATLPLPRRRGRSRC